MFELGIIETLIITTTVAGVVGTGLGGGIGALFRKDSNRTALMAVRTSTLGPKR